MALTAHVFPQFAVGLGTKLMSLNNVDTLKVALSNTAGPVTLATAGVSTAKLWTDWTSNVAAEISGTGYTAGGATLASVTATAGGSNNSVFTLTAANPSWTSSTITANQAIFYDSSASTVQLIAFWDFGGAVSDVSGTYTLVIAGGGICTITAS